MKWIGERMTTSATLLDYLCAQDAENTIAALLAAAGAEAKRLGRRDLMRKIRDLEDMLEADDAG